MESSPNGQSTYCQNTSQMDTSEQQACKKKHRAPNFTDKEVRVLLGLVFTHLDTIENKKVDAESCRLKVLTWNSIAEMYNKVTGTSKRTSEMLKTKYEGIKKFARRKEVKNRRESQKAEPEHVKMDDFEVELLKKLEEYGQPSEPLDAIESLRPESVFFNNFEPNIKYESEENNAEPTTTTLLNTDSDLSDEGRFIITDDDMVWDLPDDHMHRPRMYLIKRQLEQLGKEEERRIKEHEIRMKHEEMKIRMLEIEHAKRMELLELEIVLKKRALELDS